MPLTQTEIAEHLDLDQSAVSRFLAQADLNWKASTLDEIRVLYIRKLRGNAAGHRTDGGDDLVRERVLTERVDREMKVYTLAEKKRVADQRGAARTGADADGGRIQV